MRANNGLNVKKGSKTVNRKTIEKKRKPYHGDKCNEVKPIYCVTEEYGVTLHAVKRWDERVFGAEPGRRIPDEEAERIAKIIVNSLDFELNPAITGTFPLLDDYRVVIIGGRIITIKVSNGHVHNNKS